MNVDQALLNGDLQENIYVEIPEELEVHQPKKEGSKLLWLKRLLQELRLLCSTPTLWCNKKSTVVLNQDLS